MAVAAPPDKGQQIKDKVCVAVRIRPLNKKELQEGCRNILEVEGRQQLTLERGEKQEPIKYVFDHVFPPESSQEQVYQELGRPLVDCAVDGYNCTMFAYGQTGSGKTHTMLNHNAGENCGVVPRFSAELFQRVEQTQEQSPHRKFLVSCSFLEIYNEILYDLFVPNRKKGAVGLEIREQKGIGIYVKDLTEIVVDSSEKLMGLIEQGFLARVTAATKMNEASSRSHCILIVKMFQKDEKDPSNNTRATVNLVDLAGSERAKDTGAEGDLLKEGANINKSLAALGNVINALSSQATGQKKTFVPYRNSKLTRVLQESLGGNSFCTMLSNASPASSNCEETMSTLTYARRAKVISVKAIKNEERAQVAKLNNEVEALKEKLMSTVEPDDLGSAERRDLEEKYDRQIEELQGFIKQTWEDKRNLSEQHENERLRLLDEAKLRGEQLKQERRRRIELLTTQGDLMSTVRELQALDGNLCSTWAARLEHAQTLDQQLRSQVLAVRLYRNATQQDFELWQGKRNEFAASQQFLQQISSKLTSMRKELTSLAMLEDELMSVLMGVVPEAERAVKCCAESSELAEVTTLVVHQLEAYRREIRCFLARSRSELTIEGGLQDLRDALGKDFHLTEFEKHDEEGALPMPLGLSSGRIEDAHLSASSNTSASMCGRLLSEEGPFGGWSAGQEAATEFFEVDLQEELHICGISIQGRIPITGAWEQTRELLKHAFGDRPLPSGEPLPSIDRVYVRPPVRFVHDVASSFVREFGVFQGAFSDDQLDFACLTTKDLKLAFFQKLVDCASSVDGVDHLQLSATDILKGENTVETGRLLQLLAYLGLGKSDRSGQVTGGLADFRTQWTTSYSLDFHVGGVWESICKPDGSTMMFDGNVDGSTAHTTMLASFSARRIRVKPQEWHLHPALRIEVYGSATRWAGICGALRRRAEELGVGVDALRRRDDERQAATLLTEEAAKSKQEEQQHEEAERKFQAMQQELEELRKLKAAAEERAVEAEAGRLQMQVERDKAKVLADKLQGDLARQAAAQAEGEQGIATLRSGNEELQERVEDMADQIRVLVDERDTAQWREEDLFEQMLAMEESLLDTTEGYLTDKLVEAERELDDVRLQLLSARRRRYAEAEESRKRSNGVSHSFSVPPVAVGRRPCTAPAPVSPSPKDGIDDECFKPKAETALPEEYDDDFDNDSEAEPRASPRQAFTPRQRNFGNTAGSIASELRTACVGALAAHANGGGGREPVLVADAGPPPPLRVEGSVVDSCPPTPASGSGSKAAKVLR